MRANQSRLISANRFARMAASNSYSNEGIRKGVICADREL